MSALAAIQASFSDYILDGSPAMRVCQMRVKAASSRGAGLTVRMSLIVQGKKHGLLCGTVRAAPVRRQR